MSIQLLNSFSELFLVKIIAYVLLNNKDQFEIQNHVEHTLIAYDIEWFLAIMHISPYTICLIS